MKTKENQTVKIPNLHGPSWEILARLQALIAEDKADPNPGYISWDAHPAGWKRFHAWQARAARRAREKRLLRRQLSSRPASQAPSPEIR